MPLKTQLCDSHGAGDRADLLRAPRHAGEHYRTANLRRRCAPTACAGCGRDRRTTARRRRWRHTAPVELPPGFHLTVAGAQILGGASVPASHLVYSDGLATVSVFVEAPQTDARGVVGTDANPSAPPEQPMQGLARVGSGFAFSTVVQGHQVTAVGEVPAQTVEFIAHSVKSVERPPSSRAPDDALRCCTRARAAACARRCWRSWRCCRRQPKRASMCSTSMPTRPRKCATDTRFRCCCSPENWCATGVWTPKKYIRPSRTTADRYNRGVCPTPGLDEEYPQFFHHCSC